MSIYLKSTLYGINLEHVISTKKIVDIITGAVTVEIRDTVGTVYTLDILGEAEADKLRDILFDTAGQGTVALDVTPFENKK